METGTYHVYAKSGSGTVSIGNEQYTLEASLYREAKKQPENVQKAVIYEESPGIKISQGETVSVIGDEDFLVSFVQR